MYESLARYEAETQVRLAAFDFLASVSIRRGGLVRFQDVAEFEYMGQSIPLMDPQRGIRKPKQLSAALSIRTVHARNVEARPYDDDVGNDGYLRYKWRGSDPVHAENRALRDAMTIQVPLIWFEGIAPATYVPIWPVWLVAEEPYQQQFVVALDQQQLANWGNGEARRVAEDAPRYELQVVNRRVHQPIFRAKVIVAYQRQCALCRLRHVELLDAAHIRGDAEGGVPIVSNGIAMCKIHHAAFDADIVGLRPDYVVQVREDVLHEIDGPMLTHGLQELHGQKIHLPPSASSRPDPDLLEERFTRFKQAS